MVTDSQEYAYGLSKEVLLKPTIEKFAGKELKGTKKYDTFDFIGEDITIELKSRKNCYSKYPTTIVGMNKINKIEDGERVVFMFNFTDGLYYWEYEENNFTIVMIKRRDRNNKAKPHLAIPIEVLTKLEIE